jgi:hypothetical protein
VSRLSSIRRILRDHTYFFIVPPPHTSLLFLLLAGSRTVGSTNFPNLSLCMVLQEKMSKSISCDFDQQLAQIKSWRCCVHISTLTTRRDFAHATCTSTNDYTTTTERYVRTRAAAVAYYCLFTFMLITYYRDKQRSRKRKYFAVKIITFCSCKMHGRRSIIVCMHAWQPMQARLFSLCLVWERATNMATWQFLSMSCMHPLFNQVGIYLLDSILLGTWISCVSR